MIHAGMNGSELCHPIPPPKKTQNKTKQNKTKKHQRNLKQMNP